MTSASLRRPMDSTAQHSTASRMCGSTKHALCLVRAAAAGKTAAGSSSPHRSARRGQTHQEEEAQSRPHQERRGHQGRSRPEQQACASGEPCQLSRHTPPSRAAAAAASTQSIHPPAAACQRWCACRSRRQRSACTPWGCLQGVKVVDSETKKLALQRLKEEVSRRRRRMAPEPLPGALPPTWSPHCLRTPPLHWQRGHGEQEQRRRPPFLWRKHRRRQPHPAAAAAAARVSRGPCRLSHDCVRVSPWALQEARKMMAVMADDDEAITAIPAMTKKLKVRWGGRRQPAAALVRGSAGLCSRACGRSSSRYALPALLTAACWYALSPAQAEGPQKEEAAAQEQGGAPSEGQGGTGEDGGAGCSSAGSGSSSPGRHGDVSTAAPGPGPVGVDTLPAVDPLAGASNSQRGGVDVCVAVLTGWLVPASQLPRHCVACFSLNARHAAVALPH